MAHINAGDILIVIKNSVYQGLLYARKCAHAHDIHFLLQTSQLPVSVPILQMVKLRLREME